MRELAEARRRAQKVRRAAGIATASGWTMALFAAITLVGVLFGDLVSLALGIGLGAAAYNEFRGGTKLRRFDPRGARLLGCNQIGLGLLLVAYASWSLWAALRSPALSAISGSTGDPSMDAMVERLSAMVTYGLYGGLATVGIIVPGLTAWYYFSRGRIVHRFVTETPSWVVETMRATG